MGSKRPYQSDNFHKRVFDDKEVRRIAGLKEKYGLTKKQLAERFSCSPGAIQHALDKAKELANGPAQAQSEAVEG